MLFKTVFIFALLTGVQLLPLNETVGDVESRITGGVRVPIERAPWTLSLQTISPNRHICGATLIAQNRALTAAHCFGPPPIQPSRHVVLAGSATFNSPNGLRNIVSRIIVHPRFVFSDKLRKYDIAVLHLQQPFPVRPNVRPIALPTPDFEIPEREMAAIFGWGSSNPSSTVPNEHLQYTLMPILNDFRCSGIYTGLIQQVQYCAGGYLGRGACQGDFGGALVLNGVQIGIASWGPCGHRERPNVFTRLPVFVPWIRSVS